jgi:UDP-N-acetylglucosamine 3-dehydrogenase
MVGHIERFNPAITQLKRHILESNESILALAAMRLGISPPKNVSTGVVIDLAIHDIDLVRFLTGEEIESVSAKTKNFGITPFEDCAHIFLKTKSSSASIVANWITPRKIRQLYVSLRSSFVYLNYLTQELQVFEPDNRTKQIAFEKAEPLKLELEAFLESVRNGTEPPVSGLDGTEALKAALLALQRVE